MIEATNEGGFTGEGIIGGDERVAGEEEKIDLEFVTLSLDEFPGGGGGILDGGEEIGGDLADALPRVIESKLGGVDEAERGLRARGLLRG